MADVRSLLGASTELGTTLALSGILGEINKKKISELRKKLEGSSPTVATKETINKFLKSEGLDPTKFKVLKSDKVDGYDMDGRKMVLSTGDKAVALHEAGHAIQAEKHPVLSRLGVAVSRLTPMALAANAVLAEVTDNKTSNVINKYGPGILLASAVPEAALEYDASRRAKEYLKKHYPAEYKKSADKLDEAFGTYVSDAFTGPAAWSAGRVAREMVKGAGLGSWTASQIRKVPGILKRQVEASGRAYRDIADARGVRGKARQGWRHLVGSDSDSGSKTGKAVKTLAVGGALLSPALAASEISKDPGKVSTWTRESSRVAGEILGGGKLLGGLALGQGFANVGEAVGKKVDRFITEPIKRKVSN